MYRNAVKRDVDGGVALQAPCPAHQTALAVLLACALAIGALLALGGCSSSASVDPRTQVLEDYVEQQVEDYGWTEDEIVYEDNGEGDSVLITFKPKDGSSLEMFGYDEAMAQEEADALCAELNCCVFILGCTSDDRLVSTVASTPASFDELDEESAAPIIERLTNRQDEYIEIARSGADEWLDEYTSNATTDYEGLVQASYTYGDEIGSYVVAYYWEEGYCPSQDDQDAMAAWQYILDMISRATANNVVLVHGTAGGEAQTYIESYYADNMLYGFYPSQMAAEESAE